MLELAFLGRMMFGDSSNARAELFQPVVRTRALLIEDVKGRVRIVLGAPFPKVSERKRQDSGTRALVFLDEHGNDRLTVGEETDPQVAGHGIVKRMSQGFGVTIHDQAGNERGGLGWLASGRAIISLDRPDQDGWSAYVDDKTAPTVSGKNTTGVLIGTRDKSSFVYLKDTADNTRALLKVEGVAPPSFTVFQDLAKPPRQLIGSRP